MPAEPTQAKLKRRTSRKDLEEYRFDGAHARELESKRNRAWFPHLRLEQGSCAECRRLKIKCDKQIPCQSCQRRGCAALCPNGSLSTGQGTRFVLAATEHLHRRIGTLGKRIRQLEDALSSLQSQHSNEPHPLLHEDLIHKDEREDDGTGYVENADGGPVIQASDPIDAFGTLSISDHGISRFFGPTGGSESLLIANLNTSQSSHPSTATVHPTAQTGPEELSLFSQSFPFTPMGQTADVQEMIESHLPPWDRALALCETYFEQVSWIFRGVTRLQLIDDMLPVIYGKRQVAPGEDYSGPHDLALLFVIFAVGALVGPLPSNAEGEHFHQISRAAISLQPILEKPSIVTIQTLHLMSIYNAMSGSDLNSETSMEMTWSLITLASHLSQTIGLHRDSARWGLSAKMVQRRRILFWDLFVADVWQSLNTGRPPSFSLAYIDCGFPQYETDKGTVEGGFGAAFELWQCRFAAECVADVTARTLTAEAPSYATIMELDRKVREFPLPEGVANPSADLAASFQRCVLDHIRETVLMYIHRSFFAQAIIEQPVNPLKSSYAPSFLAAYRASSTILTSVREQFKIWPNTCARFWTMWTFAFSAAVVFGTVVTRGPRSPLALSAMAELEQACVLFSKASVYSIRAKKSLPILTKLSEKARYALAAAQQDPSPLSGDNGGLLWNIKQGEDKDDELSIFAGHTRFVSGKKPTELGMTNTATQARTSVHEGRGPALPQQARTIYHPEYVIQDPQTQMVPPSSGWTQPHDRLPPLGPPPPATPYSQYPPLLSNRGPPASYGWAAEPHHQAYHPQMNQPPQYFQPPPPAQYAPGGPHHYSQYAPQQQPHMYATTPAFHTQSGTLPNSDLADLGLASRDSRLDERWSSFMEDSGLLEGINFRAH